MKRSFLTALLLSFISGPALALSCVEPSFERDLNSAITVFEGHVLKIERRFDGGKRDGDLGSHLERATVRVDAPFKGDLMPGQDVTVVMQVWMPLPDGAADWTATETDQQKGIFLFGETDEETKKIAGQDIAVFSNGMCSPLVWEASPENLQLIELSVAQ